MRITLLLFFLLSFISMRCDGAIGIAPVGDIAIKHPFVMLFIGFVIINIMMHVIKESPYYFVWTFENNYVYLAQFLKFIGIHWFGKKDFYNDFYLHKAARKACKNNNLALVKRYAKGGIDFSKVHYKTKSGFHVLKTSLKRINPLHWACYNGNVEMIQFLLDCGIDINQKKCNEFCTPLHYASSLERLSVAEFLVRKGAQGWNYGQLMKDLKDLQATTTKNTSDLLSSIINIVILSLPAELEEPPRSFDHYEWICTPFHRYATIMVSGLSHQLQRDKDDFEENSAVYFLYSFFDTIYSSIEDVKERRQLLLDCKKHQNIKDYCRLFCFMEGESSLLREDDEDCKKETWFNRFLDYCVRNCSPEYSLISQKIEHAHMRMQPFIYSHLVETLAQSLCPDAVKYVMSLYHTVNQDMLAAYAVGNRRHHGYYALEEEKKQKYKQELITGADMYVAQLLDKNGQ